MTVTVRFFAALREHVGCDCVELGADGGDIADLLVSLRQKFGERAFSALSAPNVRVALNKEFVDGDCRVRDGDEVAFMPPITGG